jgi:uncharacterized membrane protein SirB2
VDYLAVKVVHQAGVALSFCGFVARGAGTLAGAAWARGRIARSLPHLVDTVLLLSAVALVWLLRLNPATAPWLVAKIAGLLVYIALAWWRAAGARRVQRIRLDRALVVFGYIVSVAITEPGRLRSI